jgi:hypothetical protein
MREEAVRYAALGIPVRLVAGESGSTTRTGTRQSESTGSITIISWETIAKMLLDRNVPEELVNKHILGAS